LPDSVVDKQARMYSLSFDDMHGRGFSNVDSLNLAAAETLAIPSKSKRKPKVYKPKSSHEIAFTCEKLIRDTSVHIKKIQKCEKDVYLVYNYSH
jgi:flagellar basal body rod protein FlgC